MKGLSLGIVVCAVWTMALQAESLMTLICTDPTDPLPASPPPVGEVVDQCHISGIRDKEKEAMGKYDESWKDVIEAFFPQFLRFFFPRIAEGIDFGKGYTFLDKELSRISKKGLGGRRGDKLVRVYRKDGEEQWLLVHIEVQGYAQQPLVFERRMYVYNYRISDRYDQPVISLAVLTDERKGFRPGAYCFAFGDFRLEMAFPVVKVLDHWDRWEELEESANPFAVVVMAHLRSQRTRRKMHDRLEWKLRLTRMLPACCLPAAGRQTGMSGDTVRIPYWGCIGS